VVQVAHRSRIPVQKEEEEPEEETVVQSPGIQVPFPGLYKDSGCKQALAELSEKESEVTGAHKKPWARVEYICHANEGSFMPAFPFSSGWGR
jgi:hypothetical protein